MRSHEPIGRAVDAATTWLYMRQEPRRGAGETARRRAEGGAGVATRVHCYRLTVGHWDRTPRTTARPV